jgi:hypothetical protein
MGNERADAAAKLAAESDAAIYNTHLPCRDYYPIVAGRAISAWQTKWTATTNNKLRNIKDRINPWPSSSQKVRKMEVILTRLRIGHSLLTHGHLMEGRHPPFCGDCIVPLTIEHVIAECPNYDVIRRGCFPNLQHLNATERLRGMIAEGDNVQYNNQRIFRFLELTNLINKF